MHEQRNISHPRGGEATEDLEPPPLGGYEGHEEPLDRQRCLQDAAGNIKSLFDANAILQITHAPDGSKRIRAHIDVDANYSLESYDIGVAEINRGDQIDYLLEQYFPHTGNDDVNIWYFVPRDGRLFLRTKDIARSTPREPAFSRMTDELNDRQLREFFDVTRELLSAEEKSDNEGLPPHKKCRFSLRHLR